MALKPLTAQLSKHLVSEAAWSVIQDSQPSHHSQLLNPELLTLNKQTLKTHPAQAANAVRVGTPVVGLAVPANRRQDRTGPSSVRHIHIWHLLIDGVRSCWQTFCLFWNAPGWCARKTSCVSPAALKIRCKQGKQRDVDKEVNAVITVVESPNGKLMRSSPTNKYFSCCATHWNNYNRKQIVFITAENKFNPYWPPQDLLLDARNHFRIRILSEKLRTRFNTSIINGGAKSRLWREYFYDIPGNCLKRKSPLKNRPTQQMDR